MKLQSKILLQVTVIIAIVTAASAYTEMRKQISENTKLEDQFRTVQSSNLFSGLENSLWNYDKVGADAAVSGMLDEKAIRQVLILDTKGDVFSGSIYNTSTGKYDIVDKTPDFASDLKSPVAKPTKVPQEKFGPTKQLTNDVRRITAALFFENNGELRHVGHMVVDYSIAEGVNRAKAAMTRLIISGVISGLIMVSLLLVSTRKAIIGPLSHLSDASSKIAGGDFSQAVHFESDDEIGDLARNFDSMRIRVKDFTDNLQAMVDARTREVLAGKRKIQNILIHIEQGILTFGSDRRIDDEFSDFVMRLYNKDREQIAGATVTDLLLDSSTLGANERDQMFAALGSIMGENILAYETNNDSLPREIKARIDNRDLILGLDWTPMVNEDGEQVVGKLMLSIRDLTKQRELEMKIAEERAANDVMMTRVAEIIAIGRKKAEDTVANAMDHIKFVRSVFASKSKVDPNELFRSLHTIKGNARVLKLKSLVDASHNAESIVANWRSGLPYDRNAFDQSIADLEQVIMGYNKTINDVMGGVAASGSFQMLHSVVSSIMPEVQDNLTKSGIKIGKISVEDEVGTWDPEHFKLVGDILTHALTNTMDHGYIQPHARGQKVGDFELRISAKRDNGRINLEVRDFGVGADMGKIKALAKQKNLPFNESDPLQVLFLDGFSTASKVTESSGRGVGLSAISHIANEDGGAANLKANSPHGLCLTVVLPVGSSQSSTERERKSA